MNATETVVDALAVHRLVRLAQVDTVPPVAEIREWLLTRYSDRRWMDLADCPWCLSFHVAILVAIARRKLPRLWPVLARVLAGSTVTGILSEYLD